MIDLTPHTVAHVDLAAGKRLKAPVKAQRQPPNGPKGAQQYIMIQRVFRAVIGEQCRARGVVREYKISELIRGFAETERHAALFPQAEELISHVAPADRDTRRDNGDEIGSLVFVLDENVVVINLAYTKV